MNGLGVRTIRAGNREVRVEARPISRPDPFSPHELELLADCQNEKVCLKVQLTDRVHDALLQPLDLYRLMARIGLKHLSDRLRVGDPLVSEPLCINTTNMERWFKPHPGGGGVVFSEPSRDSRIREDLINIAEKRGVSIQESKLEELLQDEELFSSFWTHDEITSVLREMQDEAR